MKIKHQLLLSQGLLVVLSVSIVVLNVVTFHSIEKDASFVNYSGRLRALSYKMAQLSNVIVKNHDEAINERETLMESIKAYDSTIEGLIEGSAELGVRKLMYGPALTKLEIIKESWLEKYKDLYLRVYADGDEKACDIINQGIGTYVDSINEMVTFYSKDSDSKVANAKVMNGALIFIIVLVSSYSFISANNKIKKPMNILLKELMDMDLIDKELAEKISLSKKDEIATMSSYIDELIYDGLTKVYNRRTGISKLSRMIQSEDGLQTILSLCFIDINGLKQVNDVLGHRHGDDLITTAVDVVKKMIREDDFIIRLGGDEFLIIFKDVSINVAEGIWDRILAAYDEINATLEKPFIISVSHGIIDYNSRNKSQVETLMKIADEKMYQEKRQMKEEPGFNVIR